MMLWHANYHPDGGQLFFPLDPRPFHVPLALPGDDLTPERFSASGSMAGAGSTSTRTSGTKGSSHSAERSASPTSRAVHARVSVDPAREFGCLLEASIS